MVSVNNLLHGYLFLLILIASFSFSYSIEPVWRKIHHARHVSFPNEFSDLGTGNNSSLSSVADVNSKFCYFFEQSVDHFDRQNLNKFQQRYFVNDTYFVPDKSGKGKKAYSSPVFLCVGGEGPPLDYTVLIDSVHCNDMVEIAEKHNALLLALEHRYYGLSMPPESNTDWSTSSLKFLSSEQAVADIAEFHAYISKKYDLTSANRWITFGGSYPGMMSGFARLKLPHLCYFCY